MSKSEQLGKGCQSCGCLLMLIGFALLALGLAVLVPLAIAADGPDRVTPETLEAWMLDHLLKTQKRLDSAKRGRVTAASRGGIVYSEKTGRYVFRNRQEKEREIAGLTKMLADPPLPAISPRNTGIGQLGRLDSMMLTTYHVIQIVNENKALVSVATGTLGGGSTSRWLFFLKGKPVSQLREGSKYTMLPSTKPGPYAGVFQITGRETYTTVLGTTSTVDVIEPYDIAPLLAKLTKFAKAKEPKPTKPKFRQWQTKDGQHEVVARFVKLVAETLTLEKHDGSMIDVPIDILSQKDRDYISRRKQ